MATEENHPSLYSALYGAMTDRELIGDLLQNPDFRRRAGQICREVAGPAGGEELLQEACLRLLESAGDLDPERIRSEGEFFAWFSQLARHVHLSNVLSAAAANNCTELPQGWPDSTADVPPDEIRRFIAHADACPYHARILRAEDEELRAAFNRARGLDSQGRILLGEEQRAIIAEHKRRLQSWREAALKKGSSFGHVALFNGGVEVASCDKFYDFSLIHKSRNELDTYAGLQIYGVISSDPDENVLLGFYALAGVRHGGKEKTLDLDNGYTVCLKVAELGGNNFEIHFRCVKTETLEPNPVEVEGADVISQEPPDGERREGSPGISWLPVGVPPRQPEVPAPGGGWSRPRCVQAATLFALLLLVALPSLLVVKVLGQMEEFEASFAEALRARSTLAEARAVVPPPPLIAEQETPTQVKAARPAHPRQALTLAGTKAESRPRAAVGLRPGGRVPRNSEAGEARGLARGAATRPRVPARGGDERATLHDKENNDSVMVVLRGPGHTLSNIWSLNRVVDRRATTRLISYDGQKYSASNSVLHVTKNVHLGVMLGGALREQRLRVERVTEQRPAPATFKVAWDVNVDSTSGKGPFVVALYGHIFSGGEKIFGGRLSYMGVGSSLEAAYEDAIGQAVKEVVRWIRPDDDKSLRASASEPGEAEQPQPVPTEEYSTAAYSGSYGEGLNPR